MTPTSCWLLPSSQLNMHLRRVCAAEPFVSLYFQSQWTPLVLFFLMYLYVIRNNKLHHFMRFYCMQVCPASWCTSVSMPQSSHAS